MTRPAARQKPSPPPHSKAILVQGSTRLLILVVNCCQRLEWLAMADHAATGAAQRRREGRLRAWLRYERLTPGSGMGGGRAARRATAAEASTPKDAARSPAGS